MTTNPNPYAAVAMQTAVVVSPRTAVREMYSRNWVTPERNNPPLVLADGTLVSVQGGWRFYSTPREDSNKWKCVSYSEVEVGCLTTTPEGNKLVESDWAGLRPYEEHGFNPSNPVYSWVPIKVVVEYIRLHGGIVSGVLPGWFPV